MEEIKIIELPEKPSIKPTNHIIVEDEDGTKKVLAKHFRSLFVSSLYFNSIEELKNTSLSSLKEGDVCETLGYYEPGDGGGGKYKITYNLSAVEDGGLVHYLSDSDTLRAELILNDSVNVHQFGAVGDGVTDDSKAIQAAINNASHKVIEFNNNKTYCIGSPIKINKDGIILNGNGSILAPHYCNGIDIRPKENSESMVNDVTINKLHIDCTQAFNAIYIYKSSKVDILSCKVFNVTSTGVNIKNSEFVNISFCEFIGKTSGSMITIDGSNSTGSLLVSSDDSNGNVFIETSGMNINDNGNGDVSITSDYITINDDGNGNVTIKSDDNTDTSLTHSRFINIVDCDFRDFVRAVNLLSTGSNGEINTLVNLDKCNYSTSITADNSYCIYVSCPIEMLSIYANTVTQANAFLYFGGISKGDITCRSISCLNTKNVFNIETKDGILHLDGSIKVSSGTVLFKNMNSKLHSTISWDLLPDGALFENKPNGEIYDAIHPYNYNEGRGYSIDGSKLVIHEARNLHVDWTSSINNLTEIQNGAKGQLLYIKSSTNKSLVQTVDKIELSDSSIQLGSFKGVILRHNGIKWVQIQYKDSTILQTLQDELIIDYDKITFDTNRIVVPN